MKLVLVALAIAASPEASVEELDIKIPTHLVTMCQAEGGCALVTKQAMNELSLRMFTAGFTSAKKACSKHDPI
jgi:hypothetical protein